MLFKRKGYSLIEILLAVILLGLVLVVICSVFFKALLAIKRGQTSGTAMYIANKKIDEVRSVDLGNVKGIYIDELYEHIEGFDGLPTEFDNYISWDTTSGGISEKIITGKEGTRGEYEFIIEIRNYQEESLTVDNLKSVTVEIKWYDSLQGKEKKLKVDTLLARKAY